MRKLHPEPCISHATPCSMSLLHCAPQTLGPCGPFVGRTQCYITLQCTPMWPDLLVGLVLLGQLNQGIDSTIAYQLHRS